MKPLSAISRQLSANFEEGNISREGHDFSRAEKHFFVNCHPEGALAPEGSAFRRPVGRLFTLLTIAALALLTLGAGNTPQARYTDLGHRMMCTCGCNQVLLECNHVGCTVSETMTAELRAAIDKGLNDQQALDWFTQKYGTTVLNAPTTKGFNLVAWIMPFAVLAIATWLVIWFVRRWQSHLTPSGPNVAALQGVDVEALRRQAREETEV